VVVPLAFDKLIDICRSKSEKWPELDDWQLRKSPGSVVSHPALGDAEAFGHGVRAHQGLNGKFLRGWLCVGQHKFLNIGGGSHTGSALHGLGSNQWVGVDGKALPALGSGAKPFVDSANSIRLIEVFAVDQECVTDGLVPEDLAESQKVLWMGF
jgi:hypothetical protein